MKGILPLSSGDSMILSHRCETMNMTSMPDKSDGPVYKNWYPCQEALDQCHLPTVGMGGVVDFGFWILCRLSY
jgi:hypothetical protein